MIFVLTAHHRSADWIDVQARYLRLHMFEPYTTVGSLEAVDGRDHLFDIVVPSVGSHAGKLNLMAAHVAAIASPDDVLMFLDGDAFPIADPCPRIRSSLADHALVAINRAERYGDPQPHPAFCAITVATWVRIAGDWSGGHPWTNTEGDTITDVGGNLLAALERHGLTWDKLLRTNTVDLNPLWFAVYDDLIYHHGAGFRGVSPTNRFERGPVALRLPGRAGRVVRSGERWWWRRQRRAELRSINDRLRAEMTNPDFWLQLVRPNDPAQST